MLFDRILEDSLSFIRRMLWSKKNEKATRKPFQATQSVPGEFGFIYLLDGRDTPRAVRTWMYSPKRQHLNSAQMVATSVPMDLHLYVDFLSELPDKPKAKPQNQNDDEAAPAESATAKAPKKTHRLQLLKASHFLNADGFYNYELVFWKDFDFSPPKDILLPKKMTDNVIATKFADALAFKCLELASPLKLKPEDWLKITEEVRNTVYLKLRPQGQ